jgi:GT2 family glycosyltransferase
MKPLWRCAQPATCALGFNAVVHQRSRVLALVLTYAAPEALARCVTAIAAQTRPVDEVLVIDNASPEPARPVPARLTIDVVRLETNLGPAGGHAAGLQKFLDSGADLAWVMDDDCVPSPEALERLLIHLDQLAEDGPVFPLWRDSATGEGLFLPAWCGFLVSRAIVQRLGLPRAEFVWWAEDTEYLSWRMHEAGYRAEWASDAVVEHRRVRDMATRPVWKVYYEARNTVYFRLHVQHGSRRIRTQRVVRGLSKLFAQVLLTRDRKLKKLGAYCRGVVDGVRGRLGLRVALGDTPETR